VVAHERVWILPSPGASICHTAQPLENQYMLCLFRVKPVE